MLINLVVCSLIRNFCKVKTIVLTTPLSAGWNLPSETIRPKNWKIIIKSQSLPVSLTSWLLGFLTTWLLDSLAPWLLGFLKNTSHVHTTPLQPRWIKGLKRVRYSLRHLTQTSHGLNTDSEIAFYWDFCFLFEIYLLTLHKNHNIMGLWRSKKLEMPSRWGYAWILRWSNWSMRQCKVYVVWHKNGRAQRLWGIWSPYWIVGTIGETLKQTYWLSFKYRRATLALACKWFI